MREWLTKAKEKETYEEYRKAVLYGISEEVTRFFADDAPEKYGFEQRPGQLDMAYDILDALIQNRHIAVEAGVGIGKSYAYLVPLLLYSEYLDKPVVIATSTIALQEQLMGDVERIQELLGVQREIVMVMGQAHYLCKQRIERNLDTLDPETQDALLANIAVGCSERNQFPFTIRDEVWQNVNVCGYGGPACKNCPCQCQYDYIRRRLKATRGIILCNQDFLTAHLLRRKRRQERLISSLVDVIVVDEAHNLEAKVRNALTERLTCEDLYKTLDAVPGELAELDRPLIGKSVSEAKQAAFAFFQNLYGQMRQQVEREQRDALDTERFFFNCDTGSLALLYDLAKSIHQLSDRVAELTDRTFRQSTASAVDTLRDMACLLKNLLENIEGKLVWIERTPNGAGLVCCPRDMDLAVRELYFKNRFRTVLTSATLTNSAQGELTERYAYFLRSTGFPLDSGVLAVPKPSPFPYAEHAMLYYCNDLPHPTREREAFIQKGARRLADILNISHGKALVLFTSRADMEDVYALLREMELPFQILMQEDGPSQWNVRKVFQTVTDSVLLATGTYWEGISIGGRSLSNLVIFRLPFPVPDPVIDAKMFGLRDPLIEVLVPEMVIKLKQGVGRLIRSFIDTGIVSILDPRLRDAPPSRYRDTVWATLPIQNRTSSLLELGKFYKSLTTDAS